MQRALGGEKNSDAVLITGVGLQDESLTCSDEDMKSTAEITKMLGSPKQRYLGCKAQLSEFLKAVGGWGFRLTSKLASILTF